MMGFAKKRGPAPFREEHQAISQSGVIALLGALLLVVMPHLLRQPGWIGLICLAILGWRVVRELRSWPLPPLWLRIVIVGSGVLAIYQQYHTLNGLDAGTALLTLMLCLKLTELRNQRDAMVVLMMGYFLVLSSFLYDQSMLYGLYLFAVTILLTAALLVQNHPAASLRSHYRRYLKQAGVIILQALPLMLILFLLVPRIPGPLWSLPSASSATTGLSDEMNMGEITNLANSSAVAFRVNFSGELPAAEQLYWRGPVLWHTDGRNWKRMDDQPLDSDSQPSFEPLAKAVEYTVTLEPSGRNWLFALDLPLTTPDKSQLRSDFQLLSKQPIDEVYRYTLSSVSQYRNSVLSPQQRAAALHLPVERNPQSVNLAQQWRDQYPDQQQLIGAVLRHFRDQPFYYSRTPPRLAGNDPVDQFLFSSQKGFCEHYAASFVTLMRAAGIPARVVTGYQGGEMNPLGDYLVVRQSDAHAWAEVYLDDIGWQRIDPTSVVPESRIEAFEDTQRFRETRNDALFNPTSSTLYRSWLTLQQNWDALNHQWNQWVLGFDQQKQQDFLQRIGLGSLALFEMIGVMLLALIITLAVIALLLRYQQQRNQDPLLQSYQQLCQRLVKHGLDCRPHIGPQQRCQQAMALLPEQRSQIEQLFQQYIQLRYGSANDPTQRPHFIQAVKQFRC